MATDMILKYWGELGDERIPPPFRDEEFDVFVKDGVIGWVVLAVSRDNNCQTPRWGYPARVQWGNQHGHAVKGEFYRRLMVETDFSGNITDLSVYEIDDMFEQAYLHVASHHYGEWSLIFQNDKMRQHKCAKIVRFLRKSLIWLKNKIKYFLYVNCGIRSEEIEIVEETTKESIKEMIKLGVVASS